MNNKSEGLLESGLKAMPRKKSYFVKNWQTYSMIIPGLLFFIIFIYIPLGGSVIAFQDYNIFSGVFHSKFVGFEHFVTLFTYPDFYQILRNTLLISLYQLILGFPAPIILALLLNEVRKMLFKRVIQTIFYLPHFLSWVIVGGLFINMLSPRVGMINDMIQFFGGEPIFFVQDPSYFRSIIVGTGIWKEVGWGTILYLAALAGVDPHLYEAAEMDGAGKFRQVFSVTIPSIMPTIIVLLLLQVGNVMNTGFEQIYMFLNPLVYDVGEVFDTYIFRVGLLGAQFSATTAIGIFKSVVGFILIVGANQLGKRATGNSIY